MARRTVVLAISSKLGIRIISADAGRVENHSVSYAARTDVIGGTSYADCSRTRHLLTDLCVHLFVAGIAGALS